MRGGEGRFGGGQSRYIVFVFPFIPLCVHIHVCFVCLSFPSIKVFA